MMPARIIALAMALVCLSWDLGRHLNGVGAMDIVTVAGFTALAAVVVIDLRGVGMVFLFFCAAWTVLRNITEPGTFDQITLLGVALAFGIITVTIIRTVREYRDDAGDRDFARVLNESGIFDGVEVER